MGTAVASQDPGETMAIERPATVMAWLAVTKGAQKGMTYQLRLGDNTIGRDSGNDLTVEDSAISRHHAMVKVQDDSFTLVDMGSRAGTRVAGKTLKGKDIGPAGVVEIGETRLNLVRVEDAGPGAAPVSNAGETIVDMPGGGGGVLIAQSGPDAGKSFPIATGDNVIGRGADSAVLLNDDTVSRRHALIRSEEGRFVVFDLGSRTGTLVNGDPIGGHRLLAGETIALGGAEIVLMQVGQKG